MEDSLLTTYLNTPIGWLEIAGTFQAITSVVFVETEGESDEINGTELEKALIQLTEYFDGKRTSFDLNFDFGGTAFQRQVWEAVNTISFGKTVSYLTISKLLGDAKKTRAVGSANGLNKLLIVIPCHRIIGADGNLTGYAGGLDRKKWLLNHESPLPPQLNLW